MKKGKILLSGIYLSIIALSVFSISSLKNISLDTLEIPNYSKSLLKEVTQSVLKEDEDMFTSPVISNNAFVTVHFYEINDDKERQTSSLLFYENTYMPSNGNLYESEEVFDVLSIYDGIVSNVSKDTILGNYIEIKHTDKLTSIYYTLDNIELKIGDQVNRGNILGKSGKGLLTDKYSMYFEIYNEGSAVNPEIFIVEN